VSDGTIDSVLALDGRVDAGGRMEGFLIRLLGRCVAMVDIDGIETVSRLSNNTQHQVNVAEYQYLI